MQTSDILYFLEGLLGMILLTIVQLPFLALLGAPFVIAGILFLWFTRRSNLGLIRAVVASAILAAGIATVVGFHGPMLPVYLLLYSGHVSVSVTALSYAIMFVLLCVAMYYFSHRKNAIKRRDRASRV
jgi:hypothetical protein